MTDIIIQGINGRMGKVLQELIAQRNDCRVVAGIDLTPSNGDIPVFASFNDLTVKGDVLIDFSAPAATRNAIHYCREHKLPCVICTTGLDDEIQALIDERQAARKAKNFTRADEIRDELLAIGIILKDTREGVKWSRA